MDLRERKALFEREKTVYESVKPVFRGVDGFDAYNPSIPFAWNDREYIFCRIEKRTDWARSWVRLFERVGTDEWSLVPGGMSYQLEDPFVSVIHGELVLGGTHVRYSAGKIQSFCGYFYRGTDLSDLRYFTSGPDNMKDIRLVGLPDGRIGVFSRPRGADIRQRFGSHSQIGFTIISGLNELTAEVIQDAAYIPGLFGKGEWGGCNQAYLLDDGKIGIIGHMGFAQNHEDGTELQVYSNVSFVFDQARNQAEDLAIIGTRSCYPEGPSKYPHLRDCCFTAGVVPRNDRRVDLYSGIGDCEIGRILIDDPFSDGIS